MDRRLGPLRLIGLGWYIVFCILLGLVGGLWLDGLLHVSPLFTLLGMLLGVVAAFRGVYKMIFSDDIDDRKKE